MDGDTVDVAGVRVRLKGVDAAERNTERGDAATAAMIAIAAGPDRESISFQTIEINGVRVH